MRKKKFMALLLSGMMAVSVLAGCGGMDKNKAAATLNGEPVTLGVANFAARFVQAGMDDLYVAYFGKDVWKSDLYGNGTTMQDSVKEQVMDSMEDLYVLKLHAEEKGVALTDEEKTAISDAAAAFLKENDKKALDALGATQEIVEEYLTLNTIQNKMYAAIAADVDTNVTDEEAKTSTYSYVQVFNEIYDDEEENKKMQEEQQKIAKDVKAFAKAAKEDGLEKAAEEAGYTVENGTFTADGNGVNEKVLEALKGLKETEVSDLIQTDADYFVVRLDQEMDPAATEQNKKTIVQQRRDDHYKEVLDGWKDGVEWVVDEDVWKQVNFENLFTTTQESTELEGENATETAE